MPGEERLHRIDDDNAPADISRVPELIIGKKYMTAYGAALLLPGNVDALQTVAQRLLTVAAWDAAAAVPGLQKELKKLRNDARLQTAVRNLRFALMQHRGVPQWTRPTLKPLARAAPDADDDGDDDNAGDANVRLLVSRSWRVTDAPPAADDDDDDEREGEHEFEERTSGEGCLGSSMALCGADALPESTATTRTAAMSRAKRSIASSMRRNNA